MRQKQREYNIHNIHHTFIAVLYSLEFRIQRKILSQSETENQAIQRKCGRKYQSFVRQCENETMNESKYSLLKTIQRQSCYVFYEIPYLNSIA